MARLSPASPDTSSLPPPPPGVSLQTWKDGLWEGNGEQMVFQQGHYVWRTSGERTQAIFLDPMLPGSEVRLVSAAISHFFAVYKICGKPLLKTKQLISGKWGIYLVKIEMVEFLCSLDSLSSIRFFFFNCAELVIHMLLIYMRLLPDKQLTGDKQQFDWGSLAAHANKQQVVPTSRKLPGEKKKRKKKHL